MENENKHNKKKINNIRLKYKELNNNIINI